MLTATSEYALRAVSLIARADSGRLVTAKRIAEEADIPRKNLSAILAELVRAGVLEALPGPNGGFRSARLAERLLLNSVLEPFEPVLWKRPPSPFWKSTCSDDDPCCGHEQWRKAREAFLAFLHQTTVADITAKGEVTEANAPPSGHHEHRRGRGRSRQVSREATRRSVLSFILIVGLLLGVRSAADPVVDPPIPQPDLEAFLPLVERFGVRTEDWFVAYFFRPQDIVFDANDRGRPEDFVKPQESHVEEFRKFLNAVDSNRDGRYTSRDDGFDPEYDAGSMERLDRNEDGVLTENDIAPRPNRAMRDRIQRIIESLPRDRQRYVGWPPNRRKPEQDIEEQIIGLQSQSHSSQPGDSEAARRYLRAIKTACQERASLLAPRLARGSLLFEQRCAGCHGKDGRGSGPAAKFIGDNLSGEGKFASPRDIAWGTFKFQSRDVGNLPTDEDLFATIRRGLPGSAMPSWTELSDEQVWDLVDYVKHLAERAHQSHFDDEIVPLFLLHRRITPVEPVPDQPAATPAMIREGRYSFMLMQCYTCHGVSGRGDGHRAIQADSDGRIIQARNYQATRLLKGGSNPSEIYRTIAHGIGTTPMPAHPDDLLVLTNDMPAEFTEAIRIGGGDTDAEDGFFDDQDGEGESEDSQEPQYEFRLVPGLSQVEVDQIKAYVSGLPSRQDVEMMSASDRIQRARQCRWALVHYVRSLMPLDKGDGPNGDRDLDSADRDRIHDAKGTRK